MKKLNVLFLSLVAMATVTSCTKDDNKPTPSATALELVVTDAGTQAAAVVSNAVVKLYANQDDYYKNQNVVATKTTGTDGKVTFTGLQAIEYYFTITGPSGGCLGNSVTTYHTYDAAANKYAPIVAGKTTSLPVQVVSTTTVTFTNSAPASTTSVWEVTIKDLGANSPIFYYLPSNISAQPLPMPAIGNYTILMTEVDSSGTPVAGSTPLEFPQTGLTCGVTTGSVTVGN